MPHAGARAVISGRVRSPLERGGLLDGARPGASLTAVRTSRCVRERLAAGGRAVVCGIQRRACHLAVEDGSLLVLTTAEVPLAPNAVALDVGSRSTLADAGFGVGQVVVLGGGAPRDPDRASWRVALGEAATWEPRPRVRRIVPRDLADGLRATRAAVIGEGAADSLLSLLWASGPDLLGRAGADVARRAGIPARLLGDAAVRGDGAAVARAARGLAGLGPGLTPSGDDLLAGFAAAWVLVGESLGVDAAARERVAAALRAGAEAGASPLGRAWLAHACRGELLEPMTRLVGTLLGAEPGDPGAAVRAALAVGSSSGTDWMVGFLLASRALLPAAGPDRPW